MLRSMIAPARYVQGEYVLRQLGQYIGNWGHTALLVASDSDEARVRGDLDQALATGGFSLTSAGFGRECSWREVRRIAAGLDAAPCDVIVGLGGGKALDTAKAVAHVTGKPLVIVPTVASTDAPCSSIAVIYADSGALEEYCQLRQAPNLVLVDTAIIAQAPVRLLVAGMGDALSTWFEARACAQRYANGMASVRPALAALAMAEQCYRTLQADSLAAKAACEAKQVTPALENIVEANILLSGLGFENGGLAAAHAVHNGLLQLAATHAYMHGERVAFGTLVQLQLENANEYPAVLAYCKAVGLPTCLADLGLAHATPAQIMQVAHAATAPESPIHNMPFAVNAQGLFDAICAADRLGATH